MSDSHIDSDTTSDSVAEPQGNRAAAPASAEDSRAFTATIIERPTLSRRIAVVLILILTVMLIGGLGYVVISGLLTPSAPRTAAERQLGSLETAVETASGSDSVHADYARALIGSGQYTAASRVIQSAVDAAGPTPALLVEQARLAYATDDPQALGILTNAYAMLESERVEADAERAERGITGVFTDESSALFIEAALIEGAIHSQNDDWDLAIAAYSKALDQDMTMADVMVLRGESYVMIGSTEDARADFERALEFTPDYEPALKGLDSLGGISP